MPCSIPSEPAIRSEKELKSDRLGLGRSSSMIKQVDDDSEFGLAVREVPEAWAGSGAGERGLTMEVDPGCEQPSPGSGRSPRAWPPPRGGMRAACRLTGPFLSRLEGLVDGPDG